MNQPNPPTSSIAPPARRPFDAMWWARRGVIVLIVIVLVDVSIEATLATMRRRDVNLSIVINDPSATPTPKAQISGTPPPTATPLPDLLIVKPTERLILDVQWNYHIGPRFPTTIIHAEALIDDRSVAEGQTTIDCGTAIIDCTGEAKITLAYTIPAINGSAAQRLDWPNGAYTVNIDRSDGGLRPINIKQYKFQVGP